MFFGKFAGSALVGLLVGLGTALAFKSGFFHAEALPPEEAETALNAWKDRLMGEEEHTERNVTLQASLLGSPHLGALYTCRCTDQLGEIDWTGPIGEGKEQEVTAPKAPAEEPQTREPLEEEKDEKQQITETMAVYETS
jgi:hypothetical protein